MFGLAHSNVLEIILSVASLDTRVALNGDCNPKDVLSTSSSSREVKSPKVKVKLYICSSTAEMGSTELKKHEAHL